MMWWCLADSDQRTTINEQGTGNNEREMSDGMMTQLTRTAGRQTTDRAGLFGMPASACGGFVSKAAASSASSVVQSSFNSAVKPSFIPRGSAFSVPSVAKRLRAFTLIELLVVISIIAILIAILIPVVVTAQKQAYISTTMGDMRTISTGLQAYHSDFNVYPQSTLPTGQTYYYQAKSAISAGKAYEYLAECLLGYLPGYYDGAPRNGNGFNGANPTLAQTKGFRVGVSNQVYGPYLDTSANNIVELDTTDYYIGDAFPPSGGGQASPILYFSADSSPSTTAVFSATPYAGIFCSADNSYGGTSPPVGNQTAGSTGAAFLGLIGAPSTNITNGSTITGAKNYLLVSAGPDGTFFDGDDVVYGQ